MEGACYNLSGDWRVRKKLLNRHSDSASPGKGIVACRCGLNGFWKGEER
jgi:hypothetical protein